MTCSTRTLEEAFFRFRRFWACVRSLLRGFFVRNDDALKVLFQAFVAQIHFSRDRVRNIGNDAVVGYISFVVNRTGSSGCQDQDLPSARISYNGIFYF